jgi:hypothetical protein
VVHATVPASRGGTDTSTGQAAKRSARGFYAKAGAGATVVAMALVATTYTAYAAAAVTTVPAGGSVTTVPASGLGALPNPGAGTAPPGVGTSVDTIVSWAAWIVFAIAILGLFFTAFKMMTAHHRGEGGQQTAGLLYVLGGTIVAAAASSLIGALA